MNVILKDINLFNPLSKIDQKKVSILLKDGIISKIGNIDSKEFENSEVFELDSKYVVPGFIDMHVHLREPGREDEETIVTGSNAAANGGFTEIACMPNTSPAIDSAEIINFIKKHSTKHLVNVYPIAAASLGRNGEVLSPIAELFEAGAVALSDDGVAIKTSSLLRKVLEYSKMYDLPVIEHCEDETLSDGAMNEGINSTQLGLPPLPSVSEDLIVSRDILMAEYTGGKIHIAHISTKKSIQLVRKAKQKGINITAEVTPHHFTLTEDYLKSYDTNYKMNPPLRTEEDVNAVIEGLKDGTIDCIVSDHAPHSIEEKEEEFQYAPNGIIGLETMIGLSLSELYHKKILSLKEIVEKLSINPRNILKIPVPQFSIGEPANFTILDLDSVWTVDISKFKSKSRNTPFDKRLLSGKSFGVINNNQMFIDDSFVNI
ncbi:dihydroorotase [bacterium BMS3Abin03]|nr:dihydroorotase [bacterium BMS3Abin03]MCG6960557.1 dihydroorotase [bacterium BMS3Abin03]